MVLLYKASYKIHAFQFEIKFSREPLKGEAKPARHHVLPDHIVRLLAIASSLKSQASGEDQPWVGMRPQTHAQLSPAPCYCHKILRMITLSGCPSHFPKQ